MEEKDRVIEKLQEAIRKRGITQKELSKRSGVSEENISRIMNGKNEPTLRTVMRLANALEVPMQGFFDDNIAISSLVKSVIENLPEDISMEIADANNTDWLLLGLDMKDTQLSPEEIKVVIELHKQLKERKFR